MTDVVAQAAYVLDLKGAHDRVFVSVIAGDFESPVVEPVEVNAGNQGTIDTVALAPACGSAMGTAVPPIRLAGFAHSFENGALYSICDGDVSDALQSTGIAVADRF